MLLFYSTKFLLGRGGELGATLRSPVPFCFFCFLLPLFPVASSYISASPLDDSLSFSYVTTSNRAQNSVPEWPLLKEKIYIYTTTQQLFSSINGFYLLVYFFPDPFVLLLLLLLHEFLIVQLLVRWYVPASQFLSLSLLFLPLCCVRSGPPEVLVLFLHPSPLVAPYAMLVDYYSYRTSLQPMLLSLFTYVSQSFGALSSIE